MLRHSEQSRLAAARTRTGWQLPALLGIAGLALLAQPVAAQSRGSVQASATVMEVPFTPTAATMSKWLSEWSAGGIVNPGTAQLIARTRRFRERVIESGIRTVTLASQCEEGSERPCGVLMTVSFARN